MFTQVQLNTIKEAAKSIKNQGEIAVFNKLLEMQKEKATHWPYTAIFTEEQFKVIQYCAEECKRQRSGEMSVYDMINAWNWMQENEQAYQNKALDLVMIGQLGEFVEPYDNQFGFRTIPIGVTDGMGGWIEKARFDRIEPLLESLINAYYDGDHPLESMIKADKGPYSVANTAEDVFYYEYENIHPFRDGNGRTGKILYNYLNGTLNDPIMPPNFWGGSNP